MHGIFNLVGHFRLKGVHRGVSFCERLNVVSSNMAAAETCLPSSAGSFKLKLFILWEAGAPQIVATSQEIVIHRDDIIKEGFLVKQCCSQQLAGCFALTKVTS